MIYIETGFNFPTLYSLAVRRREGDQIYSVGLNRRAMEVAHGKLEWNGLSRFVVFQIQDPRIYLSKVTWADKIFLNSELDLTETVDEFRAAASTGATQIVIADYCSKGARAVAEAERLGWTSEHNDLGYTVLTYARKHNDSGNSSGAEEAS